MKRPSAAGPSSVALVPPGSRAGEPTLGLWRRRPARDLGPGTGATMVAARAFPATRLPPGPGAAGREAAS